MEQLVVSGVTCNRDEAKKYAFCVSISYYVVLCSAVRGAPLKKKGVVTFWVWPGAAG